MNSATTPQNQTAPSHTPTSSSIRLIVAISGASGAIYGIRLLEILAQTPAVETHLIISPAATQTILSETDWSVKQVEALANVVYGVREIGASIASGSFRRHGMVIAPCSVKTLSSIAYGITGDLISRAADVTLKEGKPVIAVFRETPLHVGHLKAMLAFAEMGGILFPPVPAFYTRPQSVDDIVNNTVGRVLDRLGIENTLFSPWLGLKDALSEKP